MIFSKKIKNQEEPIIKKEADKRSSSFFSRLGLGKEKDYFIENFSLLLSSGIDVISAIDSIEEEIKTAGMKKIIAQLKEDVACGTPLAKALEDTQIFPHFVFSLIRIGEKSGKLAENLKLIVTQQKKERTFRSKVNSAMMYPVFVLGLALIVGVGIAWYILPKLSLVFSQLKIKLPLITKILIGFGNFMGKYGLIAAPVFLGTVFLLVYFIFIFSKTKFIGQKFLFMFPGIKRLIQEAELARLGFVLGILLDAGVPVVQSVHALADSASFFEYRRLYDFLAEMIEDGNSFQKSFSAYPKVKKLIPGAALQIISAGEKSGRLPEALLRIGQIYEEKTENTTKYLATLLEPVLLVIVWLGVVFVAMAVVLPIYSLVGGFNSGSGASAPPARPPVNSSVPQAPVESVSSEEVSEEINQNEEELGDAQQEEKKMEIEIMDTETGFLNVRSAPSVKGKVAGRVLPGEKYVLEEEQDGWYRIKFKEDLEGWVLSDYAQKVGE